MAVCALQPPHVGSSTSRRGVLADGVVAAATTIAAAAFLLPPFTGAAAAASAAQAQQQPAEFRNMGTQAPLPAAATADGTTAAPFTTLPNGVRVKEISEGSGGEVVRPDSKVSIQCSGRLLNLNGVVFYNTKNNDPDGFGAVPLSFQMGTGRALPGLEAGLVGMRKNGIRRIIVPAELAYSQFPDLEPKPTSESDQRALDSVVKNPRRDATILFDVRMERFK